MTYDPLKRDASWQMVLPGLYIDPAGCGHIFPDEFLAFLQVQHPQAGFDPNSKADYDLIVDFVRQLQLAADPTAPEIKFVRHDRGEH